LALYVNNLVLIRGELLLGLEMRASYTVIVENQCSLIDLFITLVELDRTHESVIAK
jgi:hypothetical protein